MAALSAMATAPLLNSVVCAVKREQITLNQSQSVLRPNCLLIQVLSEGFTAVTTLLSGTNFLQGLDHPQGFQPTGQGRAEHCLEQQEPGKEK